MIIVIGMMGYDCPALLSPPPRLTPTLALSLQGRGMVVCLLREPPAFASLRVPLLLTQKEEGTGIPRSRRYACSRPFRFSKGPWVGFVCESRLSKYNLVLAVAIVDC